MKNPELFKNGGMFIKSMKELIVRYQTAKNLDMSKDSYEGKNGLKCLLCNPIGTKYNHSYYMFRTGLNLEHQGACKKLGCPWMVITGMTCDDFATERGDECSIYFTDDKRIMNNRIRQLRRWIEIYKNFMENKRKSNAA